MLDKTEIRTKMEIYKEYLEIGKQLENITFAKIAEKMEVNHNVVGMISKMSTDDVRLVKLLTDERLSLMRKRRELRDIIGTDGCVKLLVRFKKTL